MQWCNGVLVYLLRSRGLIGNAMEPFVVPALFQDYEDGVRKVPTACITIEDAEMLARMADRGGLSSYLQNCVYKVFMALISTYLSSLLWSMLMVFVRRVT